jgi:hypothetical protein
MAPPKPSTLDGGHASQGATNAPRGTLVDDERRREAAAEAERLGREHSNKREMKVRADRLRAATDDRRATGVPGVPGAPVVQPRQSRVPDVDNSPQGAAQQAREGRTPAAPRTAERDRGERPPLPDRPDRGERADRTEKAERPEKPERPDRAERPERPARAERPSKEPAPVVDPGPGGVIDEVAVEAEELLREGSQLWRRWSVADKITIFAALTTLLGTMLPWLHRSHEQVVLGVGCGGVVHAFIAVTTIGLLIRRDRPSLDERGLRPSSARQRQLARRTALWMLLLSLTSTVAGTWFLLVYGAVRRFEVPTLEIGVGLYVSLAAGLGLSYSGFAHFIGARR